MTIFPLTTTLKRIHDCNPCITGWEAGLAAAGKSIPDDEPITFEQIVSAVGIKNALWCCRAEPQHSKLWQRYAIWCANQVRHLMTDQRSIDAIDVAARYVDGKATDAELIAVWTAAWDAARFANAAWNAARTAARNTPAAAWEAAAAARTAAAAANAARFANAAWTAAAAAAVARNAADAARFADAARNAAAVARNAQTAAFKQLVTTGTLP
jgi:hypothetical protein